MVFVGRPSHYQHDSADHKCVSNSKQQIILGVLKSVCKFCWFDIFGNIFGKEILEFLEEELRLIVCAGLTEKCEN